MKKVTQSIFEKEFLTTKNSELAKKYECSESIIRILAAAFHVKKVEQSEWSKSQEAYLIKNYGNVSMDILIKELGRSRWGIINKHRELKGKTKKKVISKIK